MTPSSITAAAAKAAGSDDFGSDSYREPLEVYLRACEEEAELTTFGRILISKMLASALANRIELHRWSVTHPEVRDERIVSPWIIVGLPRTGTSLLSILLGLDPMARPLLQWEAAHPIPPATLEDAAEDPRIARSAKDLDGLMKLNPPLQAMHPFGATLAEECVAIFMYDVRTLALETQAHVPTYARWLEQADMAPAYAQHTLALQTLQSRQPTERWILKTPNHLWHLDALLAAYPDARIIWTHRDPGPVVTSLASLANAGQRILTSRDDPRPTAEEWKRKCAFALDSAMAFDERSEAGWCQHLHYDALMARPPRRRPPALPHLRRRGGRPPCPAHGVVPGAPAAGRLRAPPLRPGRLRLDLCRAGHGVRGVHRALPDRQGRSPPRGLQGFLIGRLVVCPSNENLFYGSMGVRSTTRPGLRLPDWGFGHEEDRRPAHRGGGRAARHARVGRAAHRSGGFQRSVIHLDLDVRHAPLALRQGARDGRHRPRA